MKIGFSCATLLASFLPFSLLTAQEENLVNIEFSVYAVSTQGLDRVHFMDTERRPQRVSFRSMSRSGLHEYAGSNRMGFFDYTGTPGTDDFEVIPLAVANIPDGVRNPLIFFFPNTQEGGLPFRTFVMDDSESRFPFESGVLFNASGRPLSIQRGNNYIPLVGRPMPPFRFSGGRATVQFYYEINGRQVLAYNNVITCRPDERVIIIILPPVMPRSTEVRTRIIRQIKPPEDEDLTNPASPRVPTPIGG